MGREILYCNKCGKLLTADDFTRGRAHTFDNRQFCTKCLPPRLDTPPATRSAKRTPSSTRMHPLPAPARPPLTLYLSLAAAAVVAAAVLAIVLLKPAPPPPIPDHPGRRIVEEAREYARLHPKAPEDVVRRWREAEKAVAGSPFAADAKRELERALAAWKEALARERQELEERIRERLGAEQFGAVLDVLEEARQRHDAPEWTNAIAARIQEVRATTDRLYPALKAKATAAHSIGGTAEVAQLRANLALWGRRDLSLDLEAELSKIVPREAVPAGATILMRYPEEGQRTYHPMGTLKDGGLLAPLYGKGARMGGFEVLKPPFAIPAKGEFWLTYSTKSAKPILLRLRVLRGDKTYPYNWTIEKPELGRPTRAKAPLREFVNYDNQYVDVDARVHSIYIQQDDPAGDLTFFEAVIFRAKD